MHRAKENDLKKIAERKVIGKKGRTTCEDERHARVLRECSKWRCVDYGFWQRIRYSIYLCHVPYLRSPLDRTDPQIFFNRLTRRVKKDAAVVKDMLAKRAEWNSSNRKASKMYIFIYYLFII